MPTDALSPEAIEELRKAIIGNRQPIPIIALIDEASERAVYDTLAKHPDISTIKLGGKLYIDPAEYAAKRARHIETPAPEPLPAPRQPGRPRKVRP